MIFLRLLNDASGCAKLKYFVSFFYKNFPSLETCYFLQKKHVCHLKAMNELYQRSKVVLRIIKN